MLVNSANTEQTTPTAGEEGRSTCPLYACQRPEAPQGSTRPVLLTGSPISSADTFPPNFFLTVRFNMYDSTAGCSPVV